MSKKYPSNKFVRLTLVCSCGHPVVYDVPKNKYMNLTIEALREISKKPCKECRINV